MDASQQDKVGGLGGKKKEAVVVEEEEEEGDWDSGSRGRGEGA